MTNNVLLSFINTKSIKNTNTGLYQQNPGVIDHKTRSVRKADKSKTC